MSTSRFTRSAAVIGGVVLLVLGVAGCGFVSMWAKGTWSDSAGTVVLTFTQEGLITGTDGCNEVSGTWEEHGNDVTLTVTIDDANTCPEIDQWLTDPVEAAIDGNTMQVYGPNTTFLGELHEQ